MGLKQRAEQYAKTHQAAKAEAVSGGNTGPIELFQTPAYGIVDNEVVEVHGFAQIPDMSLTAVCSTLGEGWTSPVPVTDCRIFRNITPDALQAMLRVEGRGKTRTASAKT
jgi:hypothetical protein